MITNQSDISLALAVWLVNDDYDYIDKPNYISATTLMRPLRQIILPQRIPPENRAVDVADLSPRAYGNAIHDSIEKAWVKNYKRNLTKLGIGEFIIDRVRVNPTDAEVLGEPDIIPVYIEHRMFREILLGSTMFTIGGKSDMITEGILQDAKSTSAYTYIGDDKDEDYKLQGSLYRWIDAAQPVPKITEDFIRINFIFTDWQKFQAKANPKYPQNRVAQKEIGLMSLKQTEEWVRDKLSVVQKYAKVFEKDLPECTDTELWLSDPVYKFFADKNKISGRSTKNFDNLADANNHMAEKGGKGVVLTVPGEPKRCAYCEAFSICTQKDRYFTA